MSEENKEPKETKQNLRIVLDNSPALAEAQEVIKKQAEKIGSQNETIKSLLSSEKEKFDQDHNAYGLRPAPVGGETAPLEEPESKKQTYELDPECDIPLSVKGESVSDIINFLSVNEKKGNKDARRILNDLTRKIIHNTKPLDIEMTHSMSSKLFMKSPLPINENDSDSERAKKEKINERLRKNRTENWRVID